MATSFPSGLDSFTNPTAVDTLDSPPHDTQHADANDAIEALQAKVGADSSAVTSSLDYKVAQLESDVSGLVTGKILQVVSTTFTDTTSATCSGAFTDLSGLSVSITPSSASSQVYFQAMIPYMYYDGGSSARRGGFILKRNGTNLVVPTSPGTRSYALGWFFDYRPADAWDSLHLASISWLDSPSSTSAVTYQLAATGNSSNGVIYVNRSQLDTDAGNYPRSVATLIAMEVGP